MGFVGRLAIAFAAISFTLFGMGIYNDPEGFYALFTGDKDQPVGGAVLLEDFALPDELTSEETLVPTVQLVPPSEGSFDVSFLAYRASLQQAIQSRDLEKVLDLSSPEILLSYEGESGRGHLSELLEAPDVGEAYWLQLEEILALPSVGDASGDYCAPYVACADLPEGAAGLEPFETAFAVKEKVIVREAPHDEAAVIEELSFNSVQIGSVIEDDQWAEVVLSNGETGFVRRDEIRKMMDAQAQFSDESGRWQMISFLPGA